MHYLICVFFTLVCLSTSAQLPEPCRYPVEYALGTFPVQPKQSDQEHFTIKLRKYYFQSGYASGFLWAGVPPVGDTENFNFAPRYVLEQVRINPVWSDADSLRTQFERMMGFIVLNLKNTGTQPHYVQLTDFFARPERLNGLSGVMETDTYGPIRYTLAGYGGNFSLASLRETHHTVDDNGITLYLNTGNSQIFIEGYYNSLPQPPEQPPYFIFDQGYVDFKFDE